MDYAFDFAILWRDPYREWLWTGFQWTCALSILAAMVSLMVGICFGAIRAVRLPVFARIVGVYIEFFRNTPLLVQLFFWYFGFPVILPDDVSAYLYRHNYEFIAGVVGLSLYTAAFMAEVVRAGIEAVPHGQTEAALSTGLTRAQALRCVILPQALRIVIPPLGNQLLNCMKNSSLAMTIAVTELTWQAWQINSYTFRGFEAVTAATLMYLVLSFVIAGGVLGLERALASPGRIAGARA